MEERSHRILGQLWRIHVPRVDLKLVSWVPDSSSSMSDYKGQIEGSFARPTFKYLKANITSFPKCCLLGRFLLWGLNTSRYSPNAEDSKKTQDHHPTVFSPSSFCLIGCDQKSLLQVAPNHLRMKGGHLLGSEITSVSWTPCQTCTHVLAHTLCIPVHTHTCTYTRPLNIPSTKTFSAFYML